MYKQYLSATQRLGKVKKKEEKQNGNPNKIDRIWEIGNGFPYSQPNSFTQIHFQFKCWNE